MPALTVPIRGRGVLVKVLVRPRAAPPQHIPTGPLPAFIDSGAGVTMIDDGVVARLGVEPVREASLLVLGRDDVSYHGTYEVEVALAHPGLPVRWVPLTAVGGAVHPVGTVAALGRDFIDQLVFTYDGPARKATVRW